VLTAEIIRDRLFPTNFSQFSRYRRRRDRAGAHVASERRIARRSWTSTAGRMDGGSVDQRGNTKRYRIAKYNTKARGSTNVPRRHVRRHDGDGDGGSNHRLRPSTWYRRSSIAFVDGIVVRLASPRPTVENGVVNFSQASAFANEGFPSATCQRVCDIFDGASLLRNSIDYRRRKS